jgi:hypothetical protein
MLLSSMTGHVGTAALGFPAEQSSAGFYAFDKLSEKSCRAWLDWTAGAAVPPVARGGSCTI